MTDINSILSSAGLFVAGGMWGSAAWRQIGPELVVAIGQDVDGLGDPFQHPANTYDDCQVWIYRGAPYAGWTVAEGEGPTDRFEILEFPDLAAALAHVAKLA